MLGNDVATAPRHARNWLALSKRGVPVRVRENPRLLDFCRVMLLIIAAAARGVVSDHGTSTASVVWVLKGTLQQES